MTVITKTRTFIFPNNVIGYVLSINIPSAGVDEVVVVVVVTVVIFVKLKRK